MIYTCINTIMERKQLKLVVFAIINHLIILKIIINLYSAAFILNILIVIASIKSAEIFQLTNGGPIEVTWNAWKETFLKINNEHAPIKTTRVNDRICPWMTPEIVKLRYTRDFLKRKSVSSPEQEIRTDFDKQYKKLKKHIICVIRKQTQEYFWDVHNKHKNNSKKLWAELNENSGVSKSKDQSCNIECNEIHLVY